MVQAVILENRWSIRVDGNGSLVLDRLDGESSTCLLRQWADQGKRSLFAITGKYAKQSAGARWMGARCDGLVNEGGKSKPDTGLIPFSSRDPRAGEDDG